MRIRHVLAAAALLASFPALAQIEGSEPEQPKKVRIIYNPVETHDFDTRVIIGDDVERPAGLNMMGRGNAEFPTMIDERVHFKRDLVKSIGLSPAKSVKATETEVK